MNNYFGLFHKWEDVVREFFYDYSFNLQEEKAQTFEAIPEPEEVIFAEYSYESYNGEAWVVYRNGDKYYEVTGNHCSCHGLEGQWRPEEYESKELLIATLERGNFYGVKGDNTRIVIAKLKEQAV